MRAPVRTFRGPAGRCSVWDFGRSAWGAATFALIAVPYWVAALLGMVSLPAAMPLLLWHAHEMLYGFAVAVIVGFLLTAGKAWTGLATPRGATLVTEARPAQR